MARLQRWVYFMMLMYEFFLRNDPVAVAENGLAVEVGEGVSFGS